MSRIKIEKSGYEDQYDILFNGIGDHNPVEPREYKLYHSNEIPPGMLHAKGYRNDWNKTGTLPALNSGDFWVDKYEVTNKAYKVFVDSGGYLNPGYWKFPFIDGEDTLEWNAAMERFRDNTGRYGPANWVMGEFPSGKDDFPVSGVSWYEAAAFANFSDKELPTIFHWTYLAEIQGAPEIVKFGNFETRRPAEVGTYQGLTRYGTYDLPGNVSEWIFNANKDERMIIGGNFQEPSYFYNYSLNASPWTRTDRIGFRCIRYINDTLRSELAQSFDYTDRDFSKADPVTDEVFAVIKELFGYKKGGLNPRIISTMDTLEWTEETVLVDVPYENTPMQIYVFLPKNIDPPFQTVIYYPHIGSLYSNSLEDMSDQYLYLDFLLKSGRAVVWPVYYSTHGRGDIKAQDYQTWRQTQIYRVVDFQITCDYLSSRHEIDTAKLAYFGVSWGGFMAPYILAIEERIKLGILGACGVHSDGSLQDLDQVNYLPRVKIPMLMLNGRYDFDFTMKKQQAFYDFLGTPEENKLWIEYEHTHGAPYVDLVNESLLWLDKYFGPVDD